MGQVLALHFERVSSYGDTRAVLTGKVVHPRWRRRTKVLDVGPPPRSLSNFPRGTNLDKLWGGVDLGLTSAALLPNWDTSGKGQPPPA